MSLFNLMDQMVLDFYRIDKEFLNYVDENATDEELDDFIKAPFSGAYSQLKRGLLIRNKYKELYETTGLAGGKE